MSCFRVQHQLCKHYGTQGHSWGKLHVCIGVVFVSFQSTLKALGHDMMPMSLTACVGSEYVVQAFLPYTGEERPLYRLMRAERSNITQKG